MIDFHCHILPGIDDGSRDIEESMALVAKEQQQGIDTIVFTSHFYAHRDSVDSFIKRREKSYRSLLSAMKQQNMEMKTFLGAEVYYFGGIGKAEMVPRLCIEGTNLLLLEMPFCQWTKDIYEDVKLLVQKQKVRVILAHIERYFEFQKDMAIMEKVLALPLTLQVNAGSFLRGSSFTDFAGKKKRKKCLSVLEEFENVLLGTDAHNMSARIPNMAEGRAVISQKLGEQVLGRIDSLGERMLSHDKE